jgi:hypothetical protein
MVPAVALPGAAPAFADDSQLPAPGRFDMHPSGEGVLRLDRATGEIALCAADAGAAAWACRVVVEAAAPPPVPESASAADRRIAAARERARVAEAERRREAAGLRAAPQGPDAAPVPPAMANGALGEADGASADRQRAAAERQELDRLRQENARLTVRLDELERRLAEVAVVAGTTTRPDAETDEAIAGIDRAVRVGIYALARFRDLAEVLGEDEPAPGR